MSQPVEKEATSSSGSKPGLVASYGGDSDSGDEEDSTVTVDESKLVDWNKLTCLLCKRKFLSKEILSKHTQFSDLHKVQYGINHVYFIVHTSQLAREFPILLEDYRIQA